MSLFNNNPAGGAPAPTGGLFGKPAGNPPTTGGGIFGGNPPAAGNPPTTGGGLFGANATPAPGGIFGGNTQQPTNTAGG